ncbi:aminotransferase class III-fold pyridoxal phosphate-dependent enzyme [Streptomyces sp. NPDC049597]|uniref:aminotransferase class III-fold pyridoxal phosphate-dependent enzyme n=1 Tax=Streptomyces sp. NPDC049597 TaxID=3155276 RepID=UPI003422B6B2
MTVQRPSAGRRHGIASRGLFRQGRNTEWAWSHRASPSSEPGAVWEQGSAPASAQPHPLFVGGFTQSAVVGRADLIDQVTDGVVHAGTFNGNPVALAAVQATMGILADEPSIRRWSASPLGSSA